MEYFQEPGTDPKKVIELVTKNHQEPLLAPDASEAKDLIEKELQEIAEATRILRVEKKKAKSGKPSPDWRSLWYDSFREAPT